METINSIYTYLPVGISVFKIYFKTVYVYILYKNNGHHFVINELQLFILILFVANI